MIILDLFFHRGLLSIFVTGLFVFELLLKFLCFIRLETQWWRFCYSIFRVIDIVVVALDLLSMILSYRFGWGAGGGIVKLLRLGKLVIHLLGVKSRSTLVTDLLPDEKKSSFLVEFEKTVEKKVEKYKESVDYKSTQSEHPEWLTPLSETELAKENEGALFALVSVATIINHFVGVEHFELEGPEAAFVEYHVAFIEIERDNRIDKVSFNVPVFGKYLRTPMKQVSSSQRHRIHLIHLTSLLLGIPG